MINSHFVFRFAASVAVLFILLSPVSTARGDAPPPFEEMVTKKLTPVYRAPNRNTAVIGKIYPNTKITAREVSRMADCPEGWYRREDKGYICGKQLRPLEAQKAALSKEDDPGIRNGMDAAFVTERKAKVYRKSRYSGKLMKKEELLKGSILSGKSNIVVEEKAYFETRSGLYVPMTHVTLLPAPIDSLSVEISEGGQVPVAVAVGSAPVIFVEPSESETPDASVKRWTPLYGEALIEAGGDFLEIPGKGFIKKDQVSVVRPAPRPKRLQSGEKWIAVDVEQQLFHAYEGERLIRLIPCSTGIKGNTDKGRYRIQLKLRQQTMRLRMGRQRVEDVQWVMYYDRDNSIAIHSAYWHEDFGTPKSHGCVNLPTQDAHWVYDWTDPQPARTDSVTLPLPRGSGTRVVVF